jgi:predicted RNA-binding protein with PUA-like domain|tara:strand:- start:43 stop:459 length:417 start_codon:yes stop_codon:yes gene_type:complete
MRYWLLKTEPEEWSWNDQLQCKKRGSVWDGVRNFQARNNLKLMKINDHCFFYHTGKEKRVVGIVKVVKEYFPEKNDMSGKFVSIMVQAYKSLKYAVSLNDIKKQRNLSHLALIKQSRLSVMPIDSKSWKIICKMGKVI